MCGGGNIDEFKSMASVGLGATQILIGLFSIGFGVWGWLTRASYFYICFAMWCGLLFLVAGCLAAAAASGSKHKKSLITATMALCIISLLAGVTQVVLSLISYVNSRDVLDTGGINMCFHNTTGDVYPVTTETVNVTTVITVTGGLWCASGLDLCSKWYDAVYNGYICTSADDVQTSESIALLCMVAGAVLIPIALANAIICCNCCMKNSKVSPMSNMGSNYSGSTPLLASGKRGHTTGMQTDYSIYGGPHYDHMYGPHYGPPYAPPPPPPQPQVYVLPIPGYDGKGPLPHQYDPYPYPYPPSHRYSRPRSASPRYGSPLLPVPRPVIHHQDRARDVYKVGAARHEPVKTEHVKMESGPPNLDGAEVVRVGETIIRIPQK